MTLEILIPYPVWLQKRHRKAIQGLTLAVVLPHDKNTVDGNSDALCDDCQIIREYIEARFEK